MLFGRRQKQEEPALRLLSDYSYDELARLKLDVESELAARGTAELDALKEKILTIAAASGVSLNALFNPRKEKKKREAKPKYRNPDDPSATWSGRGKPPVWLQDKLDAGAAKEDFAIA